VSVALSATSRPQLRKFARVQFDDVRGRTVLQYPEGAMFLNDTAAEILALCDGRRTIADIAGALREKYDADVTDDVTAYLSALADRELVHDASD
jgi:pyrroloquinoline quinone biosynthesis protein D